MSDYLYACHHRKVNSGELSRLTRVVEAFVNRQGEIALTDQNERLFDYGNQRITEQQKVYIQNGNRRAFWNARKEVGDPIASVALPILEDSGVNGRVANWLTGLRSNPEKLNALGVDLMIEHAKAVTIDIENCIGNVPGVLSPEQVAEYHHVVFEKHRISSFLLGSDGSWLFGGTLFNLPANLYRPVWCRACDFIGPSVGAR
ncbi:MAG: hypothetical protein HLX50_11905 [Alteromonadaceae bacterium]|nr:hypothetical protein [Alteromonadaceae bacterium]